MRPDFILVLVGLALMTAGVCLIMASWSTPTNNSAVNWVRLFGPIVFAAGFISFIASCFACAIQQDLCCRSCRHGNDDLKSGTPAPSRGRLRKQVSATGSRSTESDDRCIADGRSDVNSTPDRCKSHHVSRIDDVKFPVALTSQSATPRSAFRSEPSILTPVVIACQTGCCAAKTQPRQRDERCRALEDWRIKSNVMSPETVSVDTRWQHCSSSRLQCAQCHHRSTVNRTFSCPASTFANTCGNDVIACSHVDDRMSRDDRCTSADSEYGEELQAVECERCGNLNTLHTGIARNVSTYLPCQLGV